MQNGRLFAHDQKGTLSSRKLNAELEYTVREKVGLANETAEIFLLIPFGAVPLALIASVFLSLCLTPTKFFETFLRIVADKSRLQTAS